MGLTDTDSRHRLKGRIHVTKAGKVYDVTDFADRHPGGRELLEQHNGQDIENIMQSDSSHVHSKSAYTILEKYCVGPVDATGEVNGNYRKRAEDSTGQYEYPTDDLVDWSKPLLGQVENLGDKYFDWTHQQVDCPIRLFESDTVEMMTKAYWWFVPVTWVPVVIFMLWSSMTKLSTSPELWPQNALGIQHGPLSIPFLFAFGVFVWTLLEYVIHRWIFHLHPPANWPFLIRLHFSLHGQHHKSPMDPMRLVFPPVPASLFALVFYITVNMFFPSGMAQGVFSGIVTGYMAYDLTHYYVHHGGQPMFAYFQRLKTYHTQHHYKHQQLGFGISCKMWDYPFGTLIPEDIAKQKVQ